METIEDMFAPPKLDGPKQGPKKALFNVDEGQKKTILVTWDTCPNCHIAKKKLAQQINEGKIEVLETSLDENKADEFEAMMLMQENDINAFPQLLEVEKKNGQFKVCEVDAGTKKIEKCRVFKL